MIPIREKLEMDNRQKQVPPFSHCSAPGRAAPLPVVTTPAKVTRRIVWLQVSPISAFLARTLALPKGLLADDQNIEHPRTPAAALFASFLAAARLLSTCRRAMSPS